MCGWCRGRRMLGMVMMVVVGGLLLLLGSEKMLVMGMMMVELGEVMEIWIDGGGG